MYLIEDMEDKYTGIRRNAAIQNPIINEIEAILSSQSQGYDQSFINNLIQMVSLNMFKHSGPSR